MWYEMDCISILVFIDADLMCFKYVLKASFTFAKHMGFLLDVLREWEEHKTWLSYLRIIAYAQVYFTTLFKSRQEFLRDSYHLSEG